MNGFEYAEDVLPLKENPMGFALAESTTAL